MKSTKNKSETAGKAPVRQGIESKTIEAIRKRLKLKKSTIEKIRNIVDVKLAEYRRIKKTVTPEELAKAVEFDYKSKVIRQQKDRHIIDSLPPTLKKHLQRFQTSTTDSLLFAILRDLSYIDGSINTDFCNQLLNNNKIIPTDIKPNNLDAAYLKGFSDCVCYILDNT
jgi:hypothetical protein